MSGAWHQPVPYKRRPSGRRITRVFGQSYQLLTFLSRVRYLSAVKANCWKLVGHLRAPLASFRADNQVCCGQPWARIEGRRGTASAPASPALINGKQLAAVCRIKPLWRLRCCALPVCGFGEGERAASGVRVSAQFGASIAVVFCQIVLDRCGVGLIYRRPHHVDHFGDLGIPSLGVKEW